MAETARKEEEHHHHHDYDTNHFSLADLVDLALCSPEIGTVNFNILRILLHDIVQKLGIETLPVHLGEVEHNQLEKYKSYIGGNAQYTPMPGVIQVHHPGYSYGVQSTAGPDHQKVIVATTPSMMDPPHASPRTPRTGRQSHAPPPMWHLAHPQGGHGPPPATGQSGQSSQTSEGQPGSAQGNAPQQSGQTGGGQPGVDAAGQQAHTSPSRGGRSPSPASPRLLDVTKALEDKVNRLERHLEALYQLPTNSQLLDTKAAGHTGTGGMTVNDMWQIIQLNNRVASCESAIQKMATLIEDLATELNGVKGTTRSFQSDAENLLQNHSRLSTEMSPLHDKCTLVEEALDTLKKDLHSIQHQWKKELDKITKAVGVDPNNIPKFLRPTPSHSRAPSRAPSKTRSKIKKEKKDKDGSDGTSAPTSADTEPMTTEHPPDFRLMSPESIALYPIEHLEKMNAKQLEMITPSIMELMTDEQIQAVLTLRKNQPPPDVNQMHPDEIKRLKLSELEKLSPSEAAAIKPSKMVQMTAKQRRKIEEIKKKKDLDFHKMDPEHIATIPLSDLDYLTPTDAANMTESILQHMTPEQRQKVEEVKARLVAETDDAGETESTVDATGQGATGQAEDAAKPAPTELDEQGKPKTPPDGKDQPSVSPGPDGQYRDSDNREGRRSGQSAKSAKRQQERRQRHQQRQAQGHPAPGHDDHAHPHHDHPSHSHHDHHHDPVDVVKGKIPIPEESPSLGEIEARNLVQTELQKQYAQMQAQQRQLANDIQTKMEFIYERLLREIATQNQTTMPYMAVGEPDRPLGPGVCTTVGMPPGVAVCQFPDADGKRDKGTNRNDPRVCPGPGVCPQSANCPHCGPANAKAGVTGPAYLIPEQPQSPQSPRGHHHHHHTNTDQQAQQFTQQQGGQEAYVQAQGQKMRLSGQGAENDLLMREMRSLILLDLENIHNEMRNREGETAFDEQDIVERLDTIWEAIKIIKSNEETLAVKILRQDAILKKLPSETIDRIHKIPVENLEAIASAKWDKPMMLPNGTVGGSSTGKPPAPGFGKSKIGKISTGEGQTSSVDKEEIQNIYNNLANLMQETTDHKEKLERLGDVVRTMEVGMVTKQVLVDALADKADKGNINTKVSYDEFGTAIEELHSALRDLVVENFSKNEHWKTVTDNLASDVNDKLDRVEMTPVKAFFKSNIKALDEKVRLLQQQIEEPDPAGTRKKLLRDFNCISCDRHCNISGVTNAPTLPTIGPMRAGHTTASRRAFDLHRMRMQKKFDYDCRDMKTMENQMRSLGLLNPDGSVKTGSQLNMVNRFQGGSHTAITTSARIKSTHKSSNTSRKSDPIIANEEEQELVQDMPNMEGQQLYDEEEEEEIITDLPELQEGLAMAAADLEQAVQTEELLQAQYVETYADNYEE